MNPSLERETEKLVRSWMRHDAEALRDYLVAEVEDPRSNLQSIFTRHFLLWNLFQGRFAALMEEEYRFSGVMNGLSRLAAEWHEPGDAEIVLHALMKGSDNAEGQEIPHYILQAFGELPRSVDGVVVPNYVQGALEALALRGLCAAGWNPALGAFQCLWASLLEPGEVGRAASEEPRLKVLEPACGSANDYRFLHSYGLAAHIHYSGFDLCPKNVANALKLFPTVRFEQGNVFGIRASDREFDLCFVHDLLEHLSLEGMGAAIAELCRVTRRAMCVNFFNMDETSEHVVQQVEDYHWNLLSMEGVRELFASHGFEAQVLHAATFLRQRGKCEGFHNPNAYTFVLTRS